MKLIDKYLLRTFLAPLGYCLAAFILIFIISDLFNNMSDFVEAKTAIGLVVRYYIFLIPSVMVYIIPVSLLLSVLYSLSSLTKNNELTAMRASGVSLYRLMLPFLATGLTASILVAAVNETFGPWSAYWTHQFLRSEKHKHEFNVYIVNDLPYRNHNREWIIGKYNSLTFDMENITIKQFRQDGTIALKITAQKGQWLDDEWWFTDVVRQEYMPNGRPKGGAVELNFGQKQRSIAMTDFDETPQDFQHVLKDARENPEQFSSRELLGYIQRNDELPDKVVARAATDFHSRIAMPWTCVIVTILGIPFGSQTGRKGAFVGVLLSLSLFFAFYVFISIFQALGKGEYIVPWLAAWTPNFLFLILGTILIHRMR